MATTKITENLHTTSGGAATNYSFTFPYFNQSDVKVSLDGVTQDTTSYTFPTATQIKFNSDPGDDKALRIFRDTLIDQSKAVFATGSTIRATDLNNNQDQILYRIQETDKITQGDFGSQDITTTGHINLPDNCMVKFGTGKDLEILHDGSDSYISGSTGNLIISDVSGSVKIQGKHGEDAVVCLGDGAVDLYHDNVKKFATTSAGVWVGGEVDTDNVTGDAVITSGTSTSDTKVYSAKRAGEIFYGKGTVEEIQSGETWTASDDKVATTSAIDARIVDLVDDVGGFVPLTSEAAFPATNPDVNNGAGTIVSIGVLGASYTPSGGTCTIPDSTLTNISGSNVTITECGTTVLAAGFGALVETTSLLHTYKFHRLTPKATEVTTVAGISANVTTVAGISSNVTTVAGISGNVTTVANDGTDIGLVAGSIANVNTTAANIATVNDFADKYRIASSDPGSDNNEGDLYYNTSDNKLYMFNGSAWVQAVTSTADMTTDAELAAWAGTTNVTTLGTIGTGTWQGTAIATGFIANDAITGAKIADDAIDSEHYTDGSIDTAHIADNAVTTGKILNNAVTADKLADDAVDRAAIVDDAVNEDKIADIAVRAEHIATNAVTTAKINADAITGAKIADDVINSEHYVDGSIDHVHLANDIIDGDNIQDDAIDSEHYTDGSIDTAHLADDAVTSAKIADNAITAAHIAADTIIAADIAANAVTASELADDAVDTAAIADSAVTTAKIGADAVTGAKIADDAINSEHYTDGSIDTAHIADSQITTAKLATGATITNATNAAHVSVADNENTNENNLVPFIEDTSATGNVGLESDGDFHYNPSTGAVTATKFIGDGSSLTGLGTATLSDGSVTTVKLAADAVTGAKIADDAIGSEHIEVLDAALQFGDNVKAQFGAGNDLEIYHNGTDTYIESNTGSLRIGKSDNNRIVDADDNTIMGTNASAAYLAYDGNTKLETKSWGVEFIGDL